MSRRARNVTFTLAAFVFLMMSYTNCGSMDSATQAAKSSVGSNPNSPGPNSPDRAVCEADLRAKFVSSYRPVLSDSALCYRCHTDNGASPYKFASNDVSLAFSTFMNVTADRVDANAMNPSHAPGVSGPSMQSRITAARLAWDPAFAEYQKCITAAPNTGGPSTGAIEMAEKNTPELYFADGTTVALSWDLSSDQITPSTARFPAFFTIDARVDYATINGAKVATGYTFSRPRIQMFTGEQEVEVEGVIVRINGQQAKGIEPFLSARKIAKAIDPVIVYDGSVDVPLAGVSSADKISIGIGYYNLRARTDNPPIPPAATLTLASGFTAQAQVNITVGNDATARRWCVTGLATKPASTAVACPGFESVAGGGWLTARPTTFSLASLGRTLTPGETITISVWVANSSLKISNTAGTAQVVFDNVAPSAPTLGSVTIGNTQIASLVNLQDTNEQVTWCVAETTNEMNLQNSNICNNMFVAAKPTFVGLKGGGTRYVAVFVRDRAGNTARSNIASVVNPYGRITFQQLTVASNGDRAVFANRCASCHAAGAANEAQWNASSYSNSVAKKAAIQTKSAQGTQTAPHTGIVTPQESELIRVWLTQTSTPVEL